MTEEAQIAALRAELAALEKRAAQADELRERARALQDEIAVATEQNTRPKLVAERDRLRKRAEDLEAAIARERERASDREKAATRERFLARLDAPSGKTLWFPIVLFGLALVGLFVWSVIRDWMAR